MPEVDETRAGIRMGSTELVECGRWKVLLWSCSQYGVNMVGGWDRGQPGGKYDGTPSV